MKFWMAWYADGEEEEERDLATSRDILEDLVSRVTLHSSDPEGSSDSSLRRACICVGEDICRNFEEILFGTCTRIYV